MSPTPEYLAVLYVLVLLLLSGIFLQRHFGQGSYACLFCGTRNGKHSPDCRWSEFGREKSDEE